MSSSRILSILTVLCLASVAASQTPSFQPMLPGDRVAVSVAVGDRLYAGLVRGGVIEWDPESQTMLRHLDRASGLGGHQVQDMTWSGSRLLVAFKDGGITAISDPGGPDEFLQLYRDGLASLDVTCVTGRIFGSNERVYYGTSEDGIGVIEGGREGAYYSTLEGLLDDHVRDLALSEDLLLISMESGWSRLTDNVFTNWTYAESGQDTIHDLEVAPDGSIWAATSQGVKSWDDESESWTRVHGTSRFIALARDGDGMLALRSADLLVRIEGSATSMAVPAPPAGSARNISTVAAVNGEVWVGGNIFRTDQGAGTRAALAWLGRAGSGATAPIALPLCSLGVLAGFDGAAVAPDGRAWVGDRDADGVTGWNGEDWYNVNRLATVENDSSGLINFGSNVLAMTWSGERVWFNQYTQGLVGLQPAATEGGEEDWIILTPENSPLQIDGIISLAGHPDGALIICSDDQAWWGGANNAVLAADVLFDPTAPRSPDSWVHLGPEVLGGNVVSAAYAERRDVIWFATSGGGLRRWDINGPSQGPDDPLTWLDDGDDQWSDLLTDPGGGNVDFLAIRAITAGPDGSLWAGGAGLVRFTYGASLGLVTYGASYQRKTDTFTPGLVGQTVLSLAVDRNDDLWILTDSGVNRFRLGEETPLVDTYTDLLSYSNLDQAFYSASAIAPLPGGSYRDMAISEDGARLVLCSDLGALMIDVPEATDDADSFADSAYLFPNPFPGREGTASLAVGGVSVEDAGPLTLEVLNLAGQLVYRATGLDRTIELWDGRNRLGERVASGLYVVKLTQGGSTRVLTLAIAY